MATVMLFFEGTGVNWKVTPGGSGEKQGVHEYNFESHKEYNNKLDTKKVTNTHETSFDPSAVRIYFKGPHEKHTGGGTFFPDITSFAKKVAIKLQKSPLDLDALEKEFKGSIRIIRPTNQSTVSVVDKFLVSGYSRGAISACAVAKAMNDLGSVIPVDLLLNQPLPGNVYTGVGSITSKYSDLSECANIKSANIILAAQAKDVNLYHELGYKQLMPTFNKDVVIQTTLLPIHSHLNKAGMKFSQLYMQLLLAKFCKHEKNIKKYQDLIKEYYEKSFDSTKKTNQSEKIFLLSTGEERQAFIGKKVSDIDIDPIYKEVLLNKSSTDDIGKGLAICSISKRDAYPEKYDKFTYGMRNLILSETPNGKKFTKIVNASSRMIALQIETLSDKKVEKLLKFKDRYLRNLFLITQDYLSNESPSSNDKRICTQRLENNEIAFRKNAGLGVRSNPVFDTFRTFICTILGLGVLNIINAINKKNIKKMAFFNITKDESKVEENTNLTKKTLDL